MTRLAEYGLGKRKTYLSRRRRGFVGGDGSNVRFLKQMVAKSEMQASFVKGIANIYHIIFFSITLLFREGRGLATCGFDGHTVSRREWTNKFPKCTDCGQEVYSARQLRQSYYESCS